MRFEPNKADGLLIELVVEAVDLFLELPDLDKRLFLLLPVSLLLVVLVSPLHAQGQIDPELLAGMKARSIG